MKFDDLTKPQKAAVKQQGSILVSAAAGSGKTAVLSQRIIDAITREVNPLSADRLLVVTFTVAAAGEMRARIESGLNEYCQNHPENSFAARQRILLASAKICTIDSFCATLVRENFEKANVDPDFKIAEESQLSALKNTAISNVLQRYFEKNEDEFFSLLDALGCVYDESRLSEQIISIYEKAQNLPFCKNWLNNAKNLCGENSFSIWEEKAYTFAKEVLIDLCATLSDCVEKVKEEEKVFKAYGVSLESGLTKLQEAITFCENKEWDKLYNFLNTFSFEAFSSLRGAKDIKVAELAKQTREVVVKELENLGKIFFDCKENVLKGHITVGKHTNILLEITLEFANELEKLMAEKQVLSFADIEQKALSLICEEKNGEFVKTELANDFIDNYDEVLVDEFQDVNDLQNILFECLSNSSKNLFAVGDVKQSIYGFRGANPNNFLKRRKEALPLEEVKENDTKKIILGKNFRSDKDICDFVNFFFSGFMTEKNCGMQYEEDDLLIPDITINSDAPNVRVDLIEADAILGEKETEAKHIADYIEYVMAQEKGVYNKKTKEFRRAKYSDFAIILRKMKGDSTVIAAELKSRGIPVSYSKGDFLESKEIAVAVSLLSVINNPQSDIDLLCVMCSEIFGFTAEEMATIRLNDKKGTLYSAVLKQGAKGDKKVNDFLQKIADMRRLAVLFAPSKLLAAVYEKTDFLNTFSLLSDGLIRRANLMQLISEAAAFEKGRDASLGAFLSYLKGNDAKKIKPALMSSSGDSVKIMSTHYSKGLQFPICILANLSSKFNTQDIRSSLLFDAEDGISFKYFDADEGRSTSLMRELLAVKAKKNMLSEELRLFYVAATRAECSLVLMVSSKNLTKTIINAANKAKIWGGVFCSSVFGSAQNNSDLILSALFAHKDGTLLREICGEEFPLNADCGRVSVNLCSVNNAPVFEQNEEILPSIETTNDLNKRFCFEYPFSDILSLESKASVSQIAKAEHGEEYDFSAVPAFMQEQGLTGAQKGTATHKVMQFLNFANAEQDLYAELTRLYEWEFISEAEYNAVNKEAIAAFVKSELFKRIKNSSQVKREFKFITKVGAGYLYDDIKPELKDEQIVLQGAIDCLFFENEEIIVVDFKTDKVNNESILIERYKKQIDVYAFVCEKIFGKKVQQKIIYSLWLNKEINID